MDLNSLVWIEEWGFYCRNYLVKEREVSWSTSSLGSQNKTHLTGCLNTSFRWKMCEETKCQSWMTVFCHLRPRLRLQIVQTGNRRRSQVSLGRGQKVFVAETWKRHFLKTLPNILTSRKTFTLFLLEGNGQTSEKNVKVGCDGSFSSEAPPLILLLLITGTFKGTQTGTCDHFLQ